MIQNILRRISMVLILMAALGIYAFADFGPKPSVVVEFENAGDQEYYVTLVAKEDKLGSPYSRVTAEDQYGTGLWPMRTRTVWCLQGMYRSSKETGPMSGDIIRPRNSGC